LKLPKYSVYWSFELHGSHMSTKVFSGSFFSFLRSLGSFCLNLLFSILTFSQPIKPNLYVYNFS
jgi:hypothetical protein